MKKVLKRELTAKHHRYVDIHDQWHLLQPLLHPHLLTIDIVVNFIKFCTYWRKKYGLCSKSIPTCYTNSR